MKIESLTLRELRMTLKTPFETSFGVTSDRRVLLVEAHSGGLTGWGEITVFEGPFYNSETVSTAWHVFSDFIAPLIVGKEIRNASDISDLLDFIRGHEMTKAGIENAFWDIEAQQAGVPLSQLLGGTRKEIVCGVSIGIQDTPEKLVEAVSRELQAGYRRVKLKIKPGKDYDYIRLARLSFPNDLLSVDANCAYKLSAVEQLKQFDQFGLLMIEQPLAWDDIHGHAKLQTQIKTPLCLDECIHNAGHARAAIECGACKVLNVKLGRVGGHSEALQVHGVAYQNHIPTWCGGMLESGVGRAHNIAMSSLPGFNLPGDVSASSRYWAEDIIDPEVDVNRQGTIQIPSGPGIGYAPRIRRINKLTTSTKTWNMSH